MKHNRCLCPFYTTSGTSHGRSFTLFNTLNTTLGGENATQIVPFSQSCLHRRWATTDWTRFLTINNSRMIVLQTLVTRKQPPVTSTHLQ